MTRSGILAVLLTLAALAARPAAADEAPASRPADLLTASACPVYPIDDLMNGQWLFYCDYYSTGCTSGNVDGCTEEILSNDWAWPYASCGDCVTRFSEGDGPEAKTPLTTKMDYPGLGNPVNYDFVPLSKKFPERAPVRQLPQKVRRSVVSVQLDPTTTITALLFRYKVPTVPGNDPDVEAKMRSLYIAYESDTMEAPEGRKITEVVKRGNHSYQILINDSRDPRKKVFGLLLLR